MPVPVACISARWWNASTCPDWLARLKYLEVAVQVEEEVVEEKDVVQMTVVEVEVL